MAKVKVGTDVTGMSDVSGVGKTIFQGVEDHSGAYGIAAQTSLIKGVGELGIAAYKGEALANVESEVQKGIINPIVDQRSLAGEVTSLGTILGKQIGSGASEEIVNPVRQKLDATLKQYNSAVEQGIMSTAELNNRTLEVLRKAVARNPMMTNELISTANQYLELSGVSGIIKQEEDAAGKAAKANDDIRKHYLDLAKREHVTLPFDSNGNLNMSSLIETVNKREKENFVVDQINTGKTFTLNDISLHGSTAIAGITNKTTATAYQYIDAQTQSGKPWTPANALDLKNIMGSIRQEYLNIGGVNANLSAPEVKAQLDNIDKITSTITENIVNFKSGKDAAEYIKNQVTILDNQQQLGVMKMVNKAQLSTFSNIIQAMGWPNFVSYNPVLAADISMDIAKLANGFPTSTDTAYVPLTKNEGRYKGKAPAVASVSSLLEQIKTNPDNVSQGTLDTFDNNIKAINQDLAGNGMDKEVKYKFQHSLVEELGKATNKDPMSKVSREAKEGMVKQVSLYTRLQGENLDRLAGNLLAEGGSIYLDVDPSTGYLMLDAKQSSPKVLQDPYVKATINNINKGMDAYYNISEYSSKKEASKMFYKANAATFGGVTE